MHINDTLNSTHSEVVVQKILICSFIANYLMNGSTPSEALQCVVDQYVCKLGYGVIITLRVRKKFSTHRWLIPGLVTIDTKIGQVHLNMEVSFILSVQMVAYQLCLPGGSRMCHFLRPYKNAIVTH